MPQIDHYNILAYVPQSSKGVGKSDNVKTTKGGKFDENATLGGASQSNPVPVVVAEDESVVEYVTAEQYTKSRQVYVIQANTSDKGQVTEVLLARYSDEGELTALFWCDASLVTCGTLADTKIVIEQNEPVQTEPEAALTSAGTEDNRILESFVFFDPYTAGRDNTKAYENSLEKGIGLQREVAKFMNLYDGGTSISKKQQAKIDKQVHLVPLSDIPQDVVDKYPEFKAIPSPGINGTKDAFYNYWNTHVATSKVHVVVINNHAGHDGVSILGASGAVIKIDDLINLQIPQIDYVLLLGCSMGDISYKTNFAREFAKRTKGASCIIQI